MKYLKRAILCLCSFAIGLHVAGIILTGDWKGLGVGLFASSLMTALAFAGQEDAG